MAAHQHEAETTGEAYEYCRCGAVRRPGGRLERKEPWHVCGLCALPGWEKEAGVARTP